MQPNSKVIWNSSLVTKSMVIFFSLQTTYASLACVSIEFWQYQWAYLRWVEWNWSDGSSRAGEACHVTNLSRRQGARVWAVGLCRVAVEVVSPWVIVYSCPQVLPIESIEWSITKWCGLETWAICMSFRKFLRWHKTAPTFEGNLFDSLPGFSVALLLEKGRDCRNVAYCFVSFRFTTTQSLTA